MGVNRKAWQNKRLSSFLGLGLRYENASFIRPFDHSHFEKDEFRILRYHNKYEKVQLSLSFSGFYEIADNWLISGKVNSNTRLFRSIDNENPAQLFPYREGDFDFENIDLMRGVNYRIGKVIVGLHSRVVNFQKIDKVIFNSLIKDPRSDQKWEWYNPLRFDLTVGYIW